MQRGNSMMLSELGVKYYYENYFFLYKKLKERHLTKKWINSDLETQFYHLTHNIRDVNKNRVLKQKKLYSDNQFLLFNLPI